MSQGDAIALVEASLSAFLRRQDEPCAAGPAWDTYREFGLFSMLGSASGGLGLSLAEYAQMLIAVSRLNGQLAVSVAQANHARLLSQASGDGLEAAVLPVRSADIGEANAALRCDCAIPIAMLQALWIVSAGGEPGVLRACRLPAERCGQVERLPLAKGSARYRFAVRPEPAGGHEIDSSLRSSLAAKQAVDAMAIQHGQLWRGYELARKFSEERVVFNRPLAQFQSVRTRLAGIYVRLRALSAVICAACADAGKDCEEQLHSLWATYRPLALRLAGDLMQAFGGTAFMEDSGMPEIYSNVVRFSQGALWHCPRPARPSVELPRAAERTAFALALAELERAAHDGCGGALKDYLDRALADGARAQRRSARPFG